MSGKVGMKLAILGECLLISSLPGKAMRKFVDITRFAERFNIHIKRRKPGILFISLPIVLERSGSVVECLTRDRGFEPHRRHCVRKTH